MVKRSFVVPALLSAFALLPLVGCGSSGSLNSTNFSLSQVSYDFGITLVGTAASQTVAVLQNTGKSTLNLKPVVTGAADFSLVSGGCGSTLAAGQSCNVEVMYAPVTGSSPMQESVSVDLGVVGLSRTVPQAVYVTGTPGVAAVSLSASSYGFGNTFVGGVQTQTASVVTNTGNVAVTLAPALTGNASFQLVTGGCAGMLAVGATCNVVVTYAPTVASSPAQQMATVNVGTLPAVSGATVTVTGTSGTVSGTVSTTANAMVAQYTLTMPFAGTWTVSFGKDTGYGLTTSTVTTTGGATSVFVAGMLPNTTYHMRASATLGDGQTTTDVDHTFASGALPKGIPASFPVTLGTGTPQPGIEVMDQLFGSIPTSIISTDLKGNVIWAYNPNVVTYGGSKGPFIYPVKLISNGDFLMFISPNSFPAGNAGINVMREIDLAGDTVRELSMATLNTEMVAAGFPITLDYFSHDFVSLPNGHLLLIANTTKAFTNLTGYTGTKNVVGDVVIDLDANWQPDWVWNEFDHFDVNRHPWASQFPDWTHSNSLSYSTDDGDFIVSMRHQNWVAKVDFQDAKGTGNVVWKLGYQGDYTLVGGVDPTDWFYAQHDVTYATKNTTGVYSLTVMDNGDDRIYPNGKQCGTSGEPACYTTIQELQLDDTAKTATFQFHQTLPAALYNNYGGNVEILANGDVEYGMPGVSSGTATYEVTPGSNPQTVWKMTTPGSQGYRTFRLPSLYPGVQW
jgi:arylsulfate sulfotransferase